MALVSVECILNCSLHSLANGVIIISRFMRTCNLLMVGRMMRMGVNFTLPNVSKIKVGLLAQAPTGNGGDRIYEHLSIERRTVKNIRVGN